MVNKKVNKEEIKERILEIIDRENRKLNIREMTNILKKEYNIIKSPQIIKNYLEELVKEGKLITE